MRIRPTRIRRNTAPFKEEEEEEEAVFISVVNTNEDPPNAHQEEEEEEAVFICGVNTNEDPPNAHQEEEEEGVEGGTVRGLSC